MYCVRGVCFYLDKGSLLTKTRGLFYVNFFTIRRFKFLYFFIDSKRFVTTVTSAVFNRSDIFLSFFCDLNSLNLNSKLLSYNQFDHFQKITILETMHSISKKVKHQNISSMILLW